MAIVEAALGADIKAELAAALNIVDDAALTLVSNAIAKAVVKHVKLAEVAVTGSVTSGAGAGGAVIGTGVIS